MSHYSIKKKINIMPQKKRNNKLTSGGFPCKSTAASVASAYFPSSISSLTTDSALGASGFAKFSGIPVQSVSSENHNNR